MFYDSKYGNTKMAAEKIAEGLKTEGAVVEVSYVKGIHPDVAADVDVILLGAPNHMASPSREMRLFIDRLSAVQLKARFVAVFGTYAGKERTQDRAERKLEAIAQAKLPKLKLISPGLSVHVSGVSGPIVDGELPKCVEYGKRIAEQVK